MVSGGERRVSLAHLRRVGARLGQVVPALADERAQARAEPLLREGGAQLFVLDAVQQLRPGGLPDVLQLLERVARAEALAQLVRERLLREKKKSGVSLVVWVVLRLQ